MRLKEKEVMIRKRVHSIIVLVSARVRRFEVPAAGSGARGGGFGSITLLDFSFQYW